MKLKTVLQIPILLALCGVPLGVAGGQGDNPRVKAPKPSEAQLPKMRSINPVHIVKSSAPPHHNTQMSSPGHLSDPTDPDKSWYATHEAALLRIVSIMTDSDPATMTQLKMKLSSKKDSVSRIDYITTFISNLAKN